MPDAPTAVPEAEGETWSLYQRLIGVRRRHAWLGSATLETSQVANEHVLVHATGPGGQALTLALNLADEPLRLPAHAAVVEAAKPVRRGSLPAHGWAVLRP